MSANQGKEIKAMIEAAGFPVQYVNRMKAMPTYGEHYKVLIARNLTPEERGSIDDLMLLAQQDKRFNLPVRITCYF